MKACVVQHTAGHMQVSKSKKTFYSQMNQAFGTTAAVEAVPYLSYALAVRNFADNPEQAMLTAAGTYVGEAVNDEFFRSAA